MINKLLDIIVPVHIGTHPFSLNPILTIHLGNYTDEKKNFITLQRLVDDHVTSGVFSLEQGMLLQ